MPDYDILDAVLNVPGGRMKRTTLLIALAAVVCLPIWAEWRLDLGFDVPRGLGGLVGGNASFDPSVTKALTDYIFPFPEASIHYQQSLGPLRVGAGLRLFTLIVESVFWPNLYAELDLGSVAIDFQVGGGVFGVFGLYNNVQSGAVLIPDLSAWFKIGESFRIGGGAIGFMLPEVSSGIVFAYYLGAKFAVVMN
jgi:hypothetical protein